MYCSAIMFSYCRYPIAVLLYLLATKMVSYVCRFVGYVWIMDLRLVSDELVGELELVGDSWDL